MRDVSTVIPDTGVTAVIGPPGAGKSTLLRTCKKATLETVRRLYDAFAANDPETILATTDPDIDVVQTPLLPRGGEFHGHAELGHFLRRLSRPITSPVTIGDVFAASDQVAQFGSTAGIVNATGVAFDVREVHVLTLRDDKIVRFAAPRQPNRQGERRDSPAARVRRQPRFTQNASRPKRTARECRAQRIAKDAYPGQAVFAGSR